jgi:hypothetical protein
MDKKQIQGNYNIIAEFTGAFMPPPTIANNNRSKGVGATVSIALDFKCVTEKSASQSVEFIKQNKIFIKRGRVITGGAEGLRTGITNMFAAEITIEDVGGGMSMQNKQYVNLKFPHFNEWTEFNIAFEPYLRTNDENDIVDLHIAYPVTDIHYDDFNIQSAYEGEGITLFIELEIDTAGIIINGEVV